MTGKTGLKQRILTVLVGLLGLTSCFGGVSHSLIKPLDPTAPGWFVGRPPEVDSLRPTFRWEPAEGGLAPDASYDLIIYEKAASLSGREVTLGQVVYSREGLTETQHRIEEVLNSRTDYVWSVRIRRGESVSQWAHYGYWMVSLVPVPGAVGYMSESDLWLVFRTPR